MLNCYISCHYDVHSIWWPHLKDCYKNVCLCVYIRTSPGQMFCTPNRCSSALISQTRRTSNPTFVSSSRHNHFNTVCVHPKVHLPPLLSSLYCSDVVDLWLWMWLLKSWQLPQSLAKQKFKRRKWNGISDLDLHLSAAVKQSQTDGSSAEILKTKIPALNGGQLHLKCVAVQQLSRSKSPPKLCIHLFAADIGQVNIQPKPGQQTQPVIRRV